MVLFGISMVVMLLLGFPFMVVLLGSLILYITVSMPGFNFMVMIQQILTGVTPPALVCVPMFILAANIITSGKSAEKLIDMVKSFFGHIPGGLPITANACCTIFGGVSGSTQATVAAIGGTMRPMLLKAGYPSSFTIGLIINASDIAYLIPPSIGFIVYGVATSTSIGKLFLAGIIPGILVFILFSIYSFFYSRIKNIGLYPKAGFNERVAAVKTGLPVLGFPVLIIGGIYTGLFSPTEAAAASVAYALILETAIYKSLTYALVKDAFLQTGVITGVVFILVGAGQALSWMLSFLQIPQQIMPVVLGTDPTALRVIVVVIVTYFIACMFVDPIVAIYVLSPIFHPYVAAKGIDPVLLGTIVCLQVAIGSATPPFGCDIFTAQLIFKRPYFEVIRHTPPFIIILLIVTAMLVMFPALALYLPANAFI